MKIQIKHRLNGSILFEVEAGQLGNESQTLLDCAERLAGLRGWLAEVNEVAA